MNKNKVKTEKLYNPMISEYEEVASDLAPLLKETWEAGIWAHPFCEIGDDGWIVMSFADYIEVVDFMNIVIRYCDVKDSMYYRAFGCEEDCWDYFFYPEDFNLDLVEKKNKVVEKYLDVNGAPEVHFVPTLRFPPRDYALILHRLEDYNKENNREDESDRSVR